MAISTPKFRVSYVDGDEFEVQTLPWDYMQATEKFPDMDWDNPGMASMKGIYWVAWHAAVRNKLITEAVHKQKFDAWAPTVGTVEPADTGEEDAEDGDVEDPTSTSEDPSAS